MKARLVIIGIDDILRIFQDYAGMTESIPADSKCETLLFNKALMKMALKVSSETWSGPQPPESISFELKRVWGVS
ncbi:MAG: hypothetical protein KGI27_09830 [Thaumarchaeota archaeon]|nr:hypothetical protein [Nitrososphaerota archaeon]